jgi:hypothetical protein
MVRISIQEQSNSVVLRVEGSLREPWVAELERVWHSNRGLYKHVSVNLENVSYVDDAAKDLLRRMSQDGVELLATGPMMTAIVEEIVRGGAHPVASA